MVSPIASVKVYEGVLNAPSVPTPIVESASSLGTDFNTFIREKFGRNGWDNKGSDLKLVVDYPLNGALLNNAFWDTETKAIYLGAGDGKILGNTAFSKDVIFHEATHAIVDTEVKLPYKGQSGAINESFADVMAMVASNGDTKIGEDIFTPNVPGDSLRDMRTPTISHYSQIDRADGEVHLLSGVPSLAAVKVEDAIGVDKLGKIWYTALTDKLTRNSGFSGAARATILSAQMLYGNDSKESQAVRDAWDAVGVKPRFK
jgi:bacillolysin